MTEVEFEDKWGNKLLGSLSIPKNSDTVVIISHGFQSSKESKFYPELESELNAKGMGAFRFDQYGQGKNYSQLSEYRITKDVTLTKCVESLRAAIEFVRSQGDYKIKLFGASFGGLISLINASLDPNIESLILQSPVTEAISYWNSCLNDERLAKWKKNGLLFYDEKGEKFELEYGFYEDLHNFDTLKLAKNIKCPTLIVHGTADDDVSIEQSYNLAKILRVKVVEVEGANHGYKEPGKWEEKKKIIIDYLVK